MKREHVADIRIPRIAAPDAVRIGDHRADALFSRLFVSGDLDVVVEALAHLVNAVGPDNFRRSRGFHLRLDQDVCPVPVVERADDFARKFEMRRIDMNKNLCYIFNKLGDKFMYKMRNHSLICIILLFFK